MEEYLQSCKTQFWKDVLEAELGYILRRLEGARDVLSVGCGPAIIEAGLAEHGFNVTGLDISEEALGQALLRILALMQPCTLPLCSSLKGTKKRSKRQLVCFVRRVESWSCC